MFGTNLLERWSKPERMTDQAWEQLTAAVNSASDMVRQSAWDTARSARRTGAQLADGAGTRVGSAADEAGQRARLALAALAGRRPGLPWAWLLGAGLAGTVIGWAASSAARAVVGCGGESRAGERVEFVDVDRPNSPVSLDN
jgi:hypothetical protein